MMAGAAVLDLLKAVQRVRVQPAPLCRAVGLDVTSLEDSGARVSTRLVTRLLALAEQRARDPWIGLHAGEHSEPRGPMFYMMLSSPRVMEGLHRAQPFGGLLIDTLKLTSQSDQKVASLIFDVSDAAFSASRHAMEYLLMGVVRKSSSAGIVGEKEAQRLADLSVSCRWTHTADEGNGEPDYADEAALPASSTTVFHHGFSRRCRHTCRAVFSA
jgi:hypothetical protein